MGMRLVERIAVLDDTGREHTISVWQEFIRVQSLGGSSEEPGLRSYLLGDNRCNRNADGTFTEVRTGRTYRAK